MPLTAGARLWVGLPGLDFDTATHDHLARLRPGGVILFGRNWEGPDRLRDLLGGVREAAGSEGFPPPLVGVDQEGGRVQRLGPPFPRFPAARDVGWDCRDSGGPDPARSAGARLGRALAALEIEVDFAPVLDVDSNPGNPVIGDRAYSDDPGFASACGNAFAVGLLDAGVLPCGKHFPGHGDTDLDSHHDLPVVEADEATLRERELRPFREAVVAGIPLLMTAHCVYPALHPEPATYAAPLVDGLLRGAWGYEGAVVTDDLGMAGAGGDTPAERARSAAAAGCDLFMLCHDPEGAAEIAADMAGWGEEAHSPALGRIAALLSERDRLAPG